MVRDFCTVRPILETGWEAILMVHLLLTGHAAAAVADTFHAGLPGAVDVALPVICSVFTALAPTAAALLASLATSEAALKAQLQAVRDAWIAADPDGWLAVHGFFPAAVAAVQALCAAGEQVFVITTKDKGFTLRLLAAAGLSIPADRVCGRLGCRGGQTARSPRPHMHMSVQL